MATDLAPRPLGRDAASGQQGVASPGRVVDLTVLEVRPAPEAAHVPGVVEVAVPDRRRDGVEPLRVRGVVRGAAGLLAAVLAPLLVLAGVTALPVDEVARGALLVAGWLGLGVAGRVAVERRDRTQELHR